VSHQEPTRRRPYGTGTLYQKVGSWYGRWLAGGRRMNRCLGPVRQPGTSDGLTRSQAERELRRRMEQEHATAATSARLTVEEAGGRYLHQVEHVLERKPSTVQYYRIMLDRHIVPFFGDRPLERIDPDRVAAYMAAKRRDGLATNGVTEARHNGEQFGQARLAQIVQALGGQAPSEVVAAVTAEVQQFGAAGLADDLCVVAARIHEG
jgi:Stage II sporulation protein E (SpoIIE)/Phage integrase, N-terminal SAM-like domain